MPKGRALTDAEFKKALAELPLQERLALVRLMHALIELEKASRKTANRRAVQGRTPPTLH